MSYAIYLRKSRKDIELESQGDYETLARHEKQLTELACKLKLSIKNIYREVVSGESIEMRPQIQLLLSEVEQGMYDGVLVMEIERLARGDTIDQGIVARAFRMSGTKIITPIKTYDPSNEFDEEYFEFGLFMSRREYKTINRRIQRGRIASAKEGKFLGSEAPYGYDKVKIQNGKGYTLKPNDDADVVRLIYKLYTKENLGMTLIAAKLDELKIKPRYRDTWSKSTISDILRNVVYTGMMRWSYKKETKHMIDGSIVKKRRKSDDCILVQGLHDAIIDMDTYEKAQSIRTGNYHAPLKKGNKLQNPLTGLVYCKKCGQMMTRLAPCSRNPYPAIKCMNKSCDNISAPLYLIEEKVLQILGVLLQQYKVDASKADISDDESDRIRLIEDSMHKLNEESKTIQSQIDNTFDLLEQGVYDIGTFTNRNQKLKGRKEDISKSINALTNEIERLKKLQENKNSVIPTIEHVLDAYNNLPDAESKNQLLRLVLARIDYEKSERNTRGKRDNDNFTIVIHPRYPY